MSNLRSRSSQSKSKRPAQKKVFLISGVEEEVRKDLANKISKLGGTYLSLQTFKATCTHVICGKLTRSEKYLGACATGRWVLHPSYVTDSDVAGTWLEEEQYEWCDTNISRRYPCDQELAVASRRWRFLLGSNNWAFRGWKVAVVAGKKRSKVIKRLLKSGGAKIFHLKLPLTNPDSVVNTLGYIFVTDHFHAHISSLLQYGVLCIKPEFIADYLLKDPPADPMDYLVKGIGETTHSDFLQMSQVSPPSAPVSLSDSDNEYDMFGNQATKPPKSRPSTSNSQRSLSSVPSPQVSKTNMDPDGSYIDQMSSSLDDEASFQKVIESDIDHQIKKNSVGKVQSLDLDDNNKDVDVDKFLRHVKTEPDSLWTEEVIDLTSDIDDDDNNIADVDKTAITSASAAAAAADNDVDDDADILAPVPFLSSQEQYKQRSMKTLTQPTSTPAKGVTVKQVTSTQNMSPITKFFKPAALPHKPPFTDSAVVMEIEYNEPNSTQQDKHNPHPPHLSSQSSPGKILASRENISAMAARMRSIIEGKKNADNSLKQMTLEKDNGDKHNVNKQLNDQGQKIATKENIQAMAAKLSSLEKNLAHRTDISVTTENRDNRDEQIADKHLDDAAKRTTISKHQKRKAELSHALKEIKRQKVSSSEWRPTSFEITFREGECMTKSTKMPEMVTDMLDTLLDETHFTIEYLHMLLANISLKYHPKPKTLTKVMEMLLNASNATEAGLAYNVLDAVIRLHPPMDLPAQNVYIEALSGEEKISSGTTAWDLIEKCFSDILVKREAQVIMNNRMFLRFLKSLLHFSLEYAFLQTFSKQSNRHMLRWLLWYPSDIVSINKKCVQLMEHFATIISQFQHKNPHWDRQTQIEMTEIVSWMVAMVAECIRLSESPNSSGILGLRGNITSQWVKKLASHLKDIPSWSDLQHVLTSFQLPWLSLGVCEQLLDDLEDTLCQDITVSKSLTLLHIVRYHMFLLPKFHLGPKSMNASSPDSQSIRPIKAKSNQPTSDINTTVSQTDLSKILKKVNKRNPKGETALHTVCIKNNLAELKRLLKIPGIDVNIKDNFGWTPLHEACHHGNVDCVKELLNFVPAKTLDNNDNTPLCCKKLDILATNEEGITALHEAVLSKQYQVCKVLLQHGGPALLKPVTCLGYTPLDLAMDTEIYNLLCSFLTQKIHTVSESQPSVSRSQGSLICNEGDFHVPSDAMYEEVTHCEGKQICAETKSLLMFIHLVTALVQFYIQCKNLSNIYLKIQASKPSNEPVNEKADNFSAIGVKESSKLPFNCSEMDWQPTVQIEKVNQSDVGEKLSQELENKEVDLLQKDLHVLAHLRDHIERFRAHLTKIRHKKDTQAVEGALIELTLLEESFV